MAGGYIKLNRSILNWEWADDLVTYKVFTTILLLANHEDKGWHGMTIKRGQLVTSYAKLACDCGITVKQLRTALEHLKKTHELALNTSAKGTVVTVENYAKYQDAPDEEGHTVGQAEGTPEGTQGASLGQAKGKQRATNKNDKNYKNDKKDKKKEYIRACPRELGDALEEFDRYRTKTRAPLTDHGMGLIIKRVQELSGGDTAKAVAIINQSIERGWKGVFPLDKGKKQREEIDWEALDAEFRNFEGAAGDIGDISKF